MKYESQPLSGWITDPQGLCIAEKAAESMEAAGLTIVGIRSALCYDPESEDSFRMAGVIFRTADGKQNEVRVHLAQKHPWGGKTQEEVASELAKKALPCLAAA